MFLIASVYSEECYFIHAQLRSGGENDGKVSAINEKMLNTKWNDHGNKIPYYFTRNVSYTVRRRVQQEMKRIAMKTCIKFGQINFAERPRHVLKIENLDTHKKCIAGAVDYRSHTYTLWI